MSERVEHFTDLRVWRMIHHLFLDLCRDLGNARSSLVGSVVAEQVLRSAGSIGANIAEGSGRTQRKFANALDIAFGEANEAENWLCELRDAKVLPEDVASERLRTALDLEKMLRSLRVEILRDPDAVRETEVGYVVPGESTNPPESS